MGSSSFRILNYPKISPISDTKVAQVEGPILKECRQLVDDFFSDGQESWVSNEMRRRKKPLSMVAEVDKPLR